MRHDHVLVRAGRLVELDAVIEGEGLRHVDLHVVDVIAVPDRFEQAVGKAEGEDVLRCFLAQEVVDPVDLILAERFVQRCVERAGGCQVGSERLLHDDPRAWDEVRLGQHVDHDPRGRRRHAQVVQSPRLATQLLLCVGDHCCQPDRALLLRDVAQLAGERSPLNVGDRAAGELVARLAGERAERLVVELVERGADDSAVAHEAGERQVQQAGQQLATRQVTGRPEQHDHVRLHRRHQRRHDVAGIGVGRHVLGH